MKDEMQALRENNTWELVTRPDKKKVLTNKWVFKIKRDENGYITRYKARLVARGHEQKYGLDYDEVYTPVARYEVIRMLFALAVEDEMHLHQMDVVTAYIQGDLEEEVYMEQPTMCSEKYESDKVCKLKRPIYGLKQSGRAWYKRLNKFLLCIGFKNNEVNPCVYVCENQDIRTVIVIYVDDLLIACANKNNLLTIKRQLSAEFKMKDMGPVKHILGISVERDGPVGTITIMQKQYINDVISRFNMKDANSVSTPLEVGIKLTKEMEPKTETEKENMKDKPYRELVGSLVYLANSTRPDIAYASSELSRYCANPGSQHWKAAKRVIRYLKGTSDYKIVYEKSKQELYAYVDADWAGDLNDRRSCSGNVIMFANGPISWKSKKQKSVALSTMEAEYMALSEVVKELLYLKRLLEHMRMTISEGPSIIFCDNQSAIQLTKNNVYHSRSKHIDIRYHFSREAYERDEISLKYERSESMAADVLTKALCKPKHDNCVKLMKIRK